jgi:hypothetical protein
MAALREQMLGMSLLKIVAANLLAWNLCRDGQHRNAAAVAIVKTINQMQVPRAATPNANCQFACKMGFGASGEGGCFFMSDVNPADLFSAVNRIRNAIERIPGDAVNSLDPSLQQDIYEQISHPLGHVNSFCYELCILEPRPAPSAHTVFVIDLLAR